NCFGTPGVLGDGSPKAISFVTSIDQKRHQEVFVIGGRGDLFSWRDGVWEEILDAQYNVQASGVVPNYAPTCTPGNDSSSPRFTFCPKSELEPTYPGPPGFYDTPSPNSNGHDTHFDSRPHYTGSDLTGTPDAVVHYGDGGPGVGHLVLKRTIVARNRSG